MSGTRAVSVDTRHAHHRAPQYLFSDLLLQRPRVILGGTPPSKVQEVCQCECTMHEPPQRRFSHNALATKHARTIQRVQPAFLDCVRFDNVPKLRSAWRGRQRGSLRATEQSYQEQHALDVSTVNTASAVCVKEVEDLAKEQATHVWSVRPRPLSGQCLSVCMALCVRGGSARSTTHHWKVI